MTDDQIKARLSDAARAWTEREARQRIADEAFRRAARRDRNISVLILVGFLGFVASLVALVCLWMRG